MYVQMKGDYKIVKALRELSGFGWDEVKKLVTASDSVWDDYLAVSIYFSSCKVS